MQTHRVPTSPQHMHVSQGDESDEESGSAPASNNGAQSESSHDDSSSSLSDDEDHAGRAVASRDGGASHAAETESGHQVHEATDEQSMDRESIENSPDQFRDSSAFTDTFCIPHRKGIAACSKPELQFLLKRFGPCDVSTYDKSTKKELVKLCQLHSIPVSRLKDLSVDDVRTLCDSRSKKNSRRQMTCIAREEDIDYIPSDHIPPAQWRDDVTAETRFPWPFKSKRLDNVKLFLETERKMLFDVVFDDETTGPDNDTVCQDHWRSFVTDHMRVDVKNLPQGAASDVLSCIVVYPDTVKGVKSKPMFLSHWCETL